MGHLWICDASGVLIWSVDGGGMARVGLFLDGEVRVVLVVVEKVRVATGGKRAMQMQMPAA